METVKVSHLSEGSIGLILLGKYDPPACLTYGPVEYLDIGLGTCSVEPVALATHSKCNRPKLYTTGECPVSAEQSCVRKVGQVNTIEGFEIG